MSDRAPSHPSSKPSAAQSGSQTRGGSLSRSKTVTTDLNDFFLSQSGSSPQIQDDSTLLPNPDGSHSSGLLNGHGNPRQRLPLRVIIPTNDFYEPKQAPPPTYEASNCDKIHEYGGELYVEADNCLKSIQKCTFLVFTAVFLFVSFIHGSNYAGICQSAEYGPSKNSKFYDAACSAARADIITLIMTIQFLYVFMYLFCESHRNIKSELVMAAAAIKNPDFAVQEIDRSRMNKRFTCCILSCSNELFLLITYIFLASSIVSVLTIHAKCEKPFQSIFRVQELINPRTSGILPSYAKCTIGGMVSFSDAMNPALSALQLKRPEQSQGVTVTVMCFAGFAITLRLATFFLIVYLYSVSLIIFILMVVKLCYYANNDVNLVRSAVLQEMVANVD